jgi:hypothetical protein
MSSTTTQPDSPLRKTFLSLSGIIHIKSCLMNGFREGMALAMPNRLQKSWALAPDVTEPFGSPIYAMSSSQKDHYIP